MISPEKIEEWLREVEERPSSAMLILRYVTNRLRELAQRNQELLDENIELRMGRRVEDYENKIENLEYQVELLKRQLGGEVALPTAKMISLLLFNAQGQVLRVELDPADLSSQQVIARLKSGLNPDGPHLGLAAVDSREELLFVFDTGRTETLAVEGIPASGPEALDWGQAHLQEPRGAEELVAILPIAKMSLYDFAVQFSRKGFVKKIQEGFFETCVAKGFVGSGVKQGPDQTFALTLCKKEDWVGLVSRDGVVLAAEVARLPFTIEEVGRLGSSDHTVAAYVLDDHKTLLAMTNVGKVIQRDSDWIDPGNMMKKGRALFSAQKRASGVQVVGAAFAAEADWGAVLQSDGELVIYPVAELFDRGSIGTGQAPSKIAAFTVFSIPNGNNGS